MSAGFWDARYAERAFVYGEAPNAFIAAQARRFAAGSAIVDVGAGEGRNAAFLARLGHHVTAVDASAVGLSKLARLPGGEDVETIEADVTTWAPARSWDAAVTTFLHLPPAQRPAFFERLHHLLRPGGVLVAEWYRPEHRHRQLQGGPPEASFMVTKDELAAHFPTAGILLLAEADVALDEGTGHQGPSAVVRLVWEHP